MPKYGFLTPSTFDRLMTNGRGSNEIGKTGLAVVDQLALELLGVAPREEEFTPRACLWGIEHEWEAIKTYEERTLSKVIKPDFQIAPDCSYVGGTCDGLVGNVGGIEVKCPENPVNHINFGGMLTDYTYQVQGYLWIYEREWFDFISFDPRFKPEHQLQRVRIVRNDTMLAALKDRCNLAYEKAIETAEQFAQRFDAAYPKGEE